MMGGGSAVGGVGWPSGSREVGAGGWAGLGGGAGGGVGYVVGRCGRSSVVRAGAGQAGVSGAGVGDRGGVEVGGVMWGGRGGRGGGGGKCDAIGILVLCENITFLVSDVRILRILC